MIYALHGNLGTVEDWRLGHGFDFDGQVVGIDLWDRANNDCGLTGSAFDHCLADPIREKSLLLGYSLGGRLALHALGACPDCWSGAVIVSAHTGLANEEEKRQRRVKDQSWAQRARNDDWLEFLNAWNEQPIFSGPPTASVLQRQLGLEPRREQIARGFEIWSLGDQDDLAPSLANCPVPVLWITGANDEKFSDIAAGMVGVMSNARHVAIENCGHRVLDAAPAALVNAIGDFQKRIL